MGNVEIFWRRFLDKTGMNIDLKDVEVFHFELTEKVANELLSLVLEGKKKATSSSYVSYKIIGEEIPKVGDYSIVTDWSGKPYCVIETTSVEIIPFSKITYDICKKEGEDDNLESWRRGHARFFEREGNAEGYEFTEDMPVVFEEFEVVYKEEDNV